LDPTPTDRPDLDDRLLLFHSHHIGIKSKVYRAADSFFWGILPPSGRNSRLCGDGMGLLWDQDEKMTGADTSCSGYLMGQGQVIGVKRRIFSDLYKYR
jgi:hypothetical protein